MHVYIPNKHMTHGKMGPLEDGWMSIVSALTPRPSRTGVYIFYPGSEASWMEGWEKPC